MSENQRVTLKRKAGVLIPFLIMPDGKEIDVGPGNIVHDPAAMAVKFEKWLNEWLSEVAKDTEPVTMEDLAEVDYRGRVDLGPLGCADVPQVAEWIGRRIVEETDASQAD